jgi:hypothetical protein
MACEWENSTSGVAVEETRRVKCTNRDTVAPLPKKELSTGLTFVALSRVRTSDGIMIVDRLDFSRVQKLGGKYLQHRFDDYARRYPKNI